MSNFDRVLNNGEELHPMVNKEFFTMPISVEMTTFFRTYFKIDDYNKFVNKIKKDEKFKSYAIDYVRKHFHQEHRKVITDQSGEVWFFIDFKKREDKPYSLHYVQTLCELNKTMFLDNYTDIFGNKIEFEAYDAI